MCPAPCNVAVLNHLFSAMEQAGGDASPDTEIMRLRISFVRLALVALAGLSVVANAQTINLTNGVQKYGSLSGATVNMSGRCELWVTNASTPLFG